MGQAASTLQDGNKVGFHVLKVIPGSPAFSSGLEPFFDYICKVNDITIETETPNILSSIARENLDKTVQLSVYSSRSDEVRDVSIVPSHNWKGDGILGCSLRFTSYSGAAEKIWHILDVYPNSPVATAGIIAHKDYVVGLSNAPILSNDDMHEFLKTHDKKQVKFLVYNLDSDSIREVTIVPNTEWGGPGCLGCDIGTGILHRIPAYRKIQIEQKEKEKEKNPPIDNYESSKDYEHVDLFTVKKNDNSNTVVNLGTTLSSSSIKEGEGPYSPVNPHNISAPEKNVQELFPGNDADEEDLFSLQ